MKVLKYFAVLFSFVGLLLVGCSDEMQSPVSSIEKGKLKKDKKNVEYTFTSVPEPFTANPADYMKIAGRTLHLKNYPVIDIISATDSRVTGRMEHVLSLKLDVITGKGPCHGKFILTPTDLAATGGGVWEGKYEGYRSKTDDPYVFMLPLKLVAHGKGGTIDGMQGFMKADLVVITNDVYYPLPIYWTATGTGVIKEH
jgi:hypothetical protein